MKKTYTMIAALLAVAMIVLLIVHATPSMVHTAIFSRL